MRGDWACETHVDELGYLSPQLRWFGQQQLKIPQIWQQSPVFVARAQQILKGSNFTWYLQW